MARPRKPPAAKRPVVRRSGYVQVALNLPLFHLRVLDTEAQYLTKRRSEVLEMLVQRKAGILEVTRGAHAPEYKLDRKELATSRRFLWHCPAELKPRFDELRLIMGNLGAREWVMLALFEWIGLPSGIWALESASA